MLKISVVIAFFACTCRGSRDQGSETAIKTDSAVQSFAEIDQSQAQIGELAGVVDRVASALSLNPHTIAGLATAGFCLELIAVDISKWGEDISKWGEAVWGQPAWGKTFGISEWGKTTTKIADIAIDSYFAFTTRVPEAPPPRGAFVYKNSGATDVTHIFKVGDRDPVGKNDLCMAYPTVGITKAPGDLTWYIPEIGTQFAWLAPKTNGAGAHGAFMYYIHDTYRRFDVVSSFPGEFTLGWEQTTLIPAGAWMSSSGWTWDLDKLADLTSSWNEVTIAGSKIMMQAFIMLGNGYFIYTEAHTETEGKISEYGKVLSVLELVSAQQGKDGLLTFQPDLGTIDPSSLPEMFTTTLSPFKELAEKFVWLAPSELSPKGAFVYQMKDEGRFQRFNLV